MTEKQRPKLTSDREREKERTGCYCLVKHTRKKGSVEEKERERKREGDDGCVIHTARNKTDRDS